MDTPRALRPLLLVLLLAVAGYGYSSGTVLPSEPTVNPGATSSTTKPDHIWPPRLGEPYPDLYLRGTDGKRVQLSSFRGKVLLIEPIGMDCLACIGFAGGGKPGMGSFEGLGIPKWATSIEDRMIPAGFDPADDRFVYIHLLLYRIGRDGAPSLEDGQKWEKHFKVDKRANTLVLIGDPYLIGGASYNMIPGLQAVDSTFILRWDNGGHNPPHSLEQVLQDVPNLLAKVTSAL
jgi:hypothetical protein